jgi:hypothetical protein
MADRIHSSSTCKIPLSALRPTTAAASRADSWPDGTARMSNDVTTCVSSWGDVPREPVVTVAEFAAQVASRQVV